MEKFQKMSFWQIGKRFFEPVKYAKKQWIWILLTEIYDVFQSVFTVQVGVFIIHAIENKSIEWIKFWWIILVITYFFAYFFQWLKEYLNSSTNWYIHLWLREKYFWEYINMDNTFVEKTWTWKMQSIIFDWINNWVNLLNWTVLAIIVEILAIVYSFIVILNQSPSLLHFFWFIWVLVVSSCFMWVSLEKLQLTRKKSKEITLELVRRDVKIIMSKFEIFQNNKLWVEIQKQWNDLKNQIKIWQKWNNIKMFWQILSSMSIDGLQVYIYIFVWIWVIYGNYTFAYMMLMIQLLNIVSKYIWNIRNYLKDLYKSSIHIEKLWETFTLNKFYDMEFGSNFFYKSWTIQIHNMNFWYDTSPIFQSFNLELKWWTKIAFVGESWGGKTTLIKLIAGYIRPDSWEIEIDGQKLSEIKFIDYYKHIGYLTQDPSVFDGTIYENLIYALNTEPPKENLETVIKLSKCEFIWEFEKWLQTEIGERWVRLSWGQKQRLAIAKIMLKNPNIILLDEPTSALDSFNEEQISIALHNLFKWKTVIVIAHRLQTVKQADRILFFEQWKILEEGTHDELVKLNGKYKKMLDLQSGF